MFLQLNEEAVAFVARLGLVTKATAFYKGPC